jgi:hypothetical protein
MMLAAFPDCVRTDKMPEAFGPSDISSPVQRPLLVFNPFTELTASGVMGDARRASAENGERLFEIAVSLLAEKLIAGEPWRMAAIIDQIPLVFEIMIAFLCDKHVQSLGPFEIHVIEFDDQARREPHVRYCYGLYDQSGRAVPIS